MVKPLFDKDTMWVYRRTPDERNDAGDLIGVGWYPVEGLQGVPCSLRRTTNYDESNGFISLNKNNFMTADTLRFSLEFDVQGGDVVKMLTPTGYEWAIIMGERKKRSLIPRSVTFIAKHHPLPAYE